MIETIEKIIDGDTYMVTQLPARRALRMKAKLLKVFGSLFLGSGENSLKSMCMSLDENQFESLCMELIQGVRKNGVELVPATFDLEFAGDMGGLYKLIIFILETNYSNFFSLFNIGLPSFEEEQTNDHVTKKSFTRT